MKDAITGLAGALGAALLGVAGLIARRLLWGRSEDEAMAVKAAHQAVEAVDDALQSLRAEILELRTRNHALTEADTIKSQRITFLEAEGAQREKRVEHLEAKVLRLEADCA